METKTVRIMRRDATVMQRGEGWGVASRGPEFGVYLHSKQLELGRVV
jgi:hypothetical protein